MTCCDVFPFKCYYWCWNKHSLKHMHHSVHYSVIYNSQMWKQPKCLLLDECIKTLWGIYTMEYYSAIRKKEILAFATTWVDLESIILSEISQSEYWLMYSQWQVPSDFSYMWNLMNKINKVETDLWIQRTDWQRSEGMGLGAGWEGWRNSAKKKMKDSRAQRAVWWLSEGTGVEGDIWDKWWRKETLFGAVNTT